MGDLALISFLVITFIAGALALVAYNEWNEKN